MSEKAVDQRIIDGLKSLADKTLIQLESIRIADAVIGCYEKSILLNSFIEAILLNEKYEK